MSRSIPRSGGGSSPVKYRFKFNGEQGKVSYYDSETKKDVILDELKFAVLDKRASITGWNDGDSSSIYSNYVISTKKEELEVKTMKRTLAKGLYETFKDKMDKFGGNYTTNLFLITEIDGELIIGNLQLSRSGLKGWMDFEETKPDIYNNVLTISQGTAQKKGKINYFLPAFEVSPISEELVEAAMKADEELQAYFKGGVKAPESEDESTGAAPKNEKVKDDLPF